MPKENNARPPAAMGWAASLTPMVDQDTMEIYSMRLPRGRNIGVREAAHNRTGH
jgi:hypothetical protein